jgi:hypothetical protein
VNLKWTLTSYSTITHEYNVPLNYVDLVSPTSPSTSDTTTAAFTAETFTVAKWTVTPSNIASNYPITYTFTDDNDAALPNWLSIDTAAADVVSFKIDA